MTDSQIAKEEHDCVTSTWVFREFSEMHTVQWYHMRVRERDKDRDLEREREGERGRERERGLERERESFQMSST